MAKKSGPNGPPVRLDLDVDIADFGPISRGRFKIRPLTILIGPNNSGKTYAAMLVHSVLSAYLESATYWLVPRHVKAQILKPEFRSLARDLDRLLRKKPNTDGYAVIPSRLVGKICQMAFQNVESHFSQTLVSNFGLQPNNLVRIGTTSSNLSIRNSSNFSATISKNVRASHTCLKHDYLLKRKTHNFLIRPAHMKDPKFDGVVSLTNKKVYELFETLSKDLPHNLDSGTIALLTMILHIICALDEHFPLNSSYFPAARSGIMHAYKAVVSGSIHPRLLSSHTHAQAPGVSGVLSEFVASAMNTKLDNGAVFRTVGESVESNLFEGKILVSDPAVGIPEIFYRFMKKDIPIHISSSSIAEIAPLSMFLRSGLQKGDMLIIEEPEAHLHPANQLILAKHLVFLVRRGVRILLTTHSVFFLEQLSMFVKLGNLTEKQRENNDYDKNDYLLDSEVAPYVFKKKATGNYEMKEIPHSATEGISQEEFVNVSIGMYNKDALLNDTMRNGDNGDD